MRRFLLIFIFFFVSIGHGQPKESKIQWLDFNQLEKALAHKPKKVLVFFTADWCDYCKKMERKVWSKSAVITKMNQEYYAVKFNVESEEEIEFDGRVFKNQEIHTKRFPVHDLAKLLASSKAEQEFPLPATIILDENFKVLARIYNYINPKELLDLLQQR